MTRFRTAIRDRIWTVKFVRKIRNGGIDCWGLCNVEKREIRLASGVAGQDLVETLIHELLHAHAWHIDEEFVAEASEAIAAVLYHPVVREKL